MGRLARAARPGDSERGICFGCSWPHCPRIRRGEIKEGSDNVFVEGKGATRMGDSGECQCAHNGEFLHIDGSGSVFVNGRPAVRVKDATLCQRCAMPGYVVDGASTVFFGD